MSNWENQGPVTYQEYLLKRITDSLDRLVQLGNPLSGAGVTAVKQPIEVKTGIPLPSDYPHREQLIAAGFDTLGKVPKKANNLKKVKGIGTAGVNAIMTWQKVNA